MIDFDEGEGAFCPGCGDEITINNAGGYRLFCASCVERLPLWPDGVLACSLEVDEVVEIDGREVALFKWVPTKSDSFLRNGVWPPDNGAVSDDKRE